MFARLSKVARFGDTLTPEGVRLAVCNARAKKPSPVAQAFRPEDVRKVSKVARVGETLTPEGVSYRLAVCSARTGLETLTCSLGLQS
jgi:hypothetical protein